MDPRSSKREMIFPFPANDNKKIIVSKIIFEKIIASLLYVGVGTCAVLVVLGAWIFNAIYLLWKLVDSKRK